MTEEEKNEDEMRVSARRAYAREHGICLRCGKSFEPNGRTLCPSCRAKMDAALEKTRAGT